MKVGIVDFFSRFLGTGLWVLTLTTVLPFTSLGMGCDLPSLTACSGSHVYANDGDGYTLGNGNGNTFKCITVGPNFTGFINMSGNAQNVDNYLCVEVRATADIEGTMRPRINVINFGEVNQEEDWNSNGPNTFENYGVYNFQDDDIFFSPNWTSIINHSGAIINTEEDIEFRGVTLENSGTINISDNLVINAGTVVESSGTITIGEDLDVGYGFSSMDLDGGVLSIEGNIDELSGGISCTGCEITVEGDVIYAGGNNYIIELFSAANFTLEGEMELTSSSIFISDNSTVYVDGEFSAGSSSEVTFIESDVHFDDDFTMGSATNLEMVLSDVYIDGDMNILSSSSEVFIDESLVEINGDATFGSGSKMELWSSDLIVDGEMLFNWSGSELVIDLSHIMVDDEFTFQGGTIEFSNCGFIDSDGEIVIQATNVIGPSFEGGLIYSNGDIDLISSSTSGYLDFCAEGTISGVNFTGNVTECEYELDNSNENSIGFSCDQILLSAEFLDFQAIYMEEVGIVKLIWKVDEDGQNITYEVQLGGSDQDFRTIEDLQSEGNWNTISHQYLHQFDSPGTWFYRIISTNDYGKQTISPIRVVQVESNYVFEEKFMNLYPNPVRSLLNVEVVSESPESMSSMAQVFNSNGSLVAQSQIDGDGRQLVQFELSGLAAGVYTVKWKEKVVRFVKLD